MSTNGASNGEDAPPQERVHSQQNPIKIICVGAGAGGLITAYKAQKLLKNYELTIFDKNDEIGGTWYENIYPGVGCDIPSHSYTFTFEAKPDWDGFYPYGHQVQQYFLDFAAKYDLRKHVQFSTTVTQAKWCDETGTWTVHIQKADGTTSTASCHVLVNGTGPLNKWKWPSIKGRHEFKGKMVHTARWDPNMDWEGKRVAVIGNGSSGIQIIPQLAKKAGHLSVFAKSPQWIVPPVLWQDLRVIPDSEDSAMPAPAGKHWYSKAEKDIFMNDPERFLQYRKMVDGAQAERYGAYLKEHPAHDFVNGMVRQMVEDRLGAGDEEWKHLYRPSFSIGCKRPTPGDEFLETLRKGNVSNVLTPIEEFTSAGIKTVDGEMHEFDIIVCATGFDVGFAPHFEVTGLNGRNMRDEWAALPQCYLSVASPNFPNLYFIGGPTGNWAYGTVLISHEVQAEYAIKCALKISSENLHSVVPKGEVTRQWVEHVNTWHAEKSVFAEDCKSWMKYKGKIQLWPGSFFNMLKTLREPRWEDFEMVRRDANYFSFLGDGRTERELLQERGEKLDMAPYMRLDDSEPWSIDV